MQIFICLLNLLSISDVTYKREMKTNKIVSKTEHKIQYKIIMYTGTTPGRHDLKHLLDILLNYEGNLFCFSHVNIISEFVNDL